MGMTDGLRLRRGHLSAFFTGCALATACAAPNDRAKENVAVTRASFTNTPVDTDSPEANVVVRFGSCSGTLITPQIVLTALHCIWGYDGGEEGCKQFPTVGKVVIGPVWGPEYTSMPSPNDFIGKVNGCLPSGDFGDDLALVFLQEPVSPASMKKRGSFALPKPPKVVRPSLLTPELIDPPATFGVAGYATASGPRRFRSHSSVDFGQLGCPGTFWGCPTWNKGNGAWESEKGDSGSPLFVYHADNRREVVGVLFGHVGSDMVWPDVTVHPNNGFITNNVREYNVPIALRHTAGWLARHGKSETDWWGELDYSGECDDVHDFDCDGWYDRNPPQGAQVALHDNCPFVANSDQKETVDLGVGDACKPCPWDPLNDEDKDGICGVAPPWDPFYAVDNCPRIRNGATGPAVVASRLHQVNSNREAEDVKRREDASIEILGDACDPVPVPRGAPVGMSEAHPPAQVSGGGHPQFGGFFRGRIIQDRIRTQRVSPHKKTLSVAPDVSTAEAVTIEAPTMAMFCQSNKLRGYDCHAPEIMRDTHLFDPSTPDAEVRDPRFPWHRITTSLVPAVRGASWSWSYNNTSATHDWDYRADNTYWTQNLKIPEPEAKYFALCSDVVSFGPGTCLDGTMWQHAETAVGKTDPVANGQVVGLHGPDLANHYFDIKPDLAYLKIYSGAGQMRKLFFLIHTLPDPAPYELTLRRRIRPLVAQAAGNQPPHILEDHGGSWDATLITSDYLRQVLASASENGFAFVNPAEPPHLGANLESRVLGIIVNPQSSWAIDFVVDDGGTLKMGYDVAGGHHSTDPASVERAGALSVFSRTVAGLFVLGGADPSTSVALHDVTIYRWGIGWTQIANDVFEHARAATFVPSDGKLWILDDRDGGAAEIIRLDPFTAERTSHGLWTLDAAKWDQLFLSVDADGTALLTSSSRTLDRSRVARVRIGGDGIAYATQIDSDALPYVTDLPIVDIDEYGFIVRDVSGAMISIYRRSTLLGPTGTFPLDSMFQ